MTFRTGDIVRVVRPHKRGDSRLPVTERAKGRVLEVYPRFVVVQLRHFRECFGYDEVHRIGEVPKEVAG